MLTKEQFNTWQNDAVTLAFMDSVKQLEKNTTEQLIANKREDALSDDFYKGAIAALRDLLNTSFEEVSND